MDGQSVLRVQQVCEPYKDDAAALPVPLPPFRRIPADHHVSGTRFLRHGDGHQKITPCLAHQAFYTT